MATNELPKDRLGDKPRVTIDPPRRALPTKKERDHRDAMVAKELQKAQAAIVRARQWASKKDLVLQKTLHEVGRSVGEQIVRVSGGAVVTLEELAAG